jgi:hypothetical protein
MSKHTQQPWSTQEFDLYEKWLRVGPRGQEVARVRNDDIDSDEAQANLRLIAAAPDLLAALGKLVERWDADEIGQIDGEFIDDARAAIAKAEGK